MTRQLTAEQALRIARTAVGGPIDVRDIGLLGSSVHRPHASVLGQDAYPDLFSKAAVLMHSLAGNHPLVDGNKRLATYVFLAKNGVQLDPEDDAAFDLINAVAAGEIDDVGKIAAMLSSWQARAHKSSLTISSGPPESSPIRSSRRRRLGVVGFSDETSPRPRSNVSRRGGTLSVWAYGLACGHARPHVLHCDAHERKGGRPRATTEPQQVP